MHHLSGVSTSNVPLAGLELFPVISRQQHPSQDLDTRRVCAKNLPQRKKASGERLMAQRIGRLGQVLGPGIHLSGISNKLCSLGPFTVPLWTWSHYLKNEGRGQDALPAPFISDSNFYANVQQGI